MIESARPYGPKRRCYRRDKKDRMRRAGEKSGVGEVLTWRSVVARATVLRVANLELYPSNEAHHYRILMNVNSTFSFFICFDAREVEFFTQGAVTAAITVLSIDLLFGDLTRLRAARTGASQLRNRPSGVTSHPCECIAPLSRALDRHEWGSGEVDLRLLALTEFELIPRQRTPARAPREMGTRL